MSASTSPLPYTGNKSCIVNTILTVMPKHSVYTDAKPIMVLIRWGFLAEDESSSIGGKHIVINPHVLSKYRQRLLNLKIYNVDKDVCEENGTESYTNCDTQDVPEGKEDFEIMLIADELQSQYTVEELGQILSQMYEAAENKTTAIHMFGLKYAEIIKKNGYSAAAIVEASSLNGSYHVEIGKGIPTATWFGF